jgi:hypothetical protein
MHKWKKWQSGRMLRNETADSLPRHCLLAGLHYKTVEAIKFNQEDKVTAATRAKRPSLTGRRSVPLLFETCGAASNS